MEARHCPPPGCWAVCGGGGGGGRGGWSECRAGSGKLPPPSRSLQVGVGPGRVSWLRGLSRPATLSRPRPAGTGAAPLPPPPLQPPGGPGTPRLRNGCCCRPAEPGPRSRRWRPRRAGGLAAKAALGLHGEGRTPPGCHGHRAPTPTGPSPPPRPGGGAALLPAALGPPVGFGAAGVGVCTPGQCSRRPWPARRPPRDCHPGRPSELGAGLPTPTPPLPQTNFPTQARATRLPRRTPQLPTPERAPEGEAGGRGCWGGRSPVVHSPPK